MSISDQYLIGWKSLITYCCSWLRGGDCLRGNQSRLGFKCGKSCKEEKDPIRKKTKNKQTCSCNIIYELMLMCSTFWRLDTLQLEKNVKDTHCCKPTLSCRSDLFGESSDNSAGGIMLVEGMWQFLTSSLQLLPKGETVKHYSVLKEKTEWRNSHLILFS